MLISFITYIVLIIISLGLMGGIINNTSTLLLISAPLISLFFTGWFGILPKRNYFNLSCIEYFIWLLKEIVMSSISVVRIIWKKNIIIKPVLQVIKTDQKNNLGLVLYANSITLTPGTVTLSTDNKNLLIHALDVSFIEDLEKGSMDLKIQKVVK